LVRYCSECGGELRENARFCEKCGINISNIEVKNRSKEEIEKEIREKIEEEYRQKNLQEYKEKKERELREEMEKKLKKQKAQERITQRKYYLSYFKFNLDKKELTQIAIISLCIATALIFITFIIGSIMMISYDKSQTINMEIGFPLNWIRFQTFAYNKDIGHLPPYLEIFNWFNTIFNFIIYTALVFGLSYPIEVILKNNRRIKQAIRTTE
jgi:hypothetical protein